MPIVVEPTVVGSGTEVVLDPVEVATNRTELHLNAGPIRVADDGIDWGDAALEQFMAELDYGQVSIDHRVPNRSISIPLVVGADGSTGFATALRDLQAKVALIQREGGWLRRGTGLYADVVAATLKLPDHRGWLGVEQATLVLEALPDFYGDEVSRTLHSEGTWPWLSFVEADVAGDYPARTRITVTDDQGEAQLGVLWGIRSRYYDDAETAALAFQAEALTPLDTAAVATVAGASGGGSNNVVRHGNLAPTWTPVLSTEIDGVGHMTHRGTYRVWARAYSTSTDELLLASPPSLRLIWDVGDLVRPVENAEAALTYPVGSFYLLDLGQVRLDAPPLGDHRWQGVIQAKGAEGGEEVSIDYILLQPIDDGAGRVLSEPSPDPPLSGYAIRDEFGGSAGSLVGSDLTITGATNATPIVVTANGHGVSNGQTVMVGGVDGNTAANGVWVVSNVTTNTLRLVGSAGNGAYTGGGVLSKAGRALPVGGGAWYGTGSSPDFALDGDGAIERSIVSETATADGYLGRWAIAVGAAPFTSVAARVEIEMENEDLTAYTANGSTSLYGRFKDPSNYFQVRHSTQRLIILKSVDGVTSNVAGTDVVASRPTNRWTTLTVQITEGGQFYVWLTDTDGRQERVMSGQDPDLATGGALASGYVGIYDYGGTFSVVTRRYDNFAAWVPNNDAAIHPERTIELRTDGTYHQDATGTSYAPIPGLGDLPRLPPSGPEERNVEVLIKASRGDLSTLPDTGIDDLSATVAYRPAWLFRPTP